MYLVYADESGSYNDGSYDPEQPGAWQPASPRETSHFAVGAVIIDTKNWKSDFLRLKNLRENLKDIYEIPLSEHLHANKLIAGLDRWKHISRKGFDRPKRVRLLKALLHEYGQWADTRVIAAVVDKTYSSPGINPATCQQLAYETLLNRVERTLDGQFILIHDGAEDIRIIRMVRKMQVFNPIQRVNRPLTKIIEDPLFKLGDHSYFLQAVDHIAYTILHAFDKRYNHDVAEVLNESRILRRIGVASACHATAATLPGIVPVPTPKRA